jgi:hypothetical protein
MSDRDWHDAMKAKGHSPIMIDYGNGEGSVINMMAVEYDHHNGPACAICSWGCCEHCETIDDIPECDVIEATVAPASICEDSTP